MFGDGLLLRDARCHTWEGGLGIEPKPKTKVVLTFCRVAAEKAIEIKAAAVWDILKPTS